MASIGPLHIPVRLSVGSLDYEIGALEIDMFASPVPGDRYAVSISAREGSVRPQLIDLLRAAADHIEQGGGDDAAAH